MRTTLCGFTVLIGVFAGHVHRGLVGVQDLLGRQCVPHRPVKPGSAKLLGEPLMRAGHEPGRHRRPQQRGHEHRGAFHRHIPRRGQHDRRRVHIQPVGDSTGLPERHRRRSGFPTAATLPLRQHIVHLLQPDRRNIPDLRPRGAHVLTAGQIPAAPGTLPRHRHGLGPVRLHLRDKSRALPARLPTRLPLLRTHPLRLLCATLPLRRRRILRWRSRRVRRIKPQPPPQRDVLRLQSLNPGNQTLNQSRQLVIRRTTRPSLLHTKIISHTRQPTHIRPPDKPASQTNP